MKMKPYKFTYKTVIRKSTELVSYNSPHINTKEAELDIEMAIRNLEVRDNFEEGLAILLENNLWKEKGMGGRAFIQETFELNKSIERHLKIYETLTGTARPDPA